MTTMERLAAFIADHGNEIVSIMDDHILVIEDLTTIDGQHIEELHKVRNFGEAKALLGY